MRLACSDENDLKNWMAGGSLPYKQIDPELLRQVNNLIPVFANAVFVVYARNGEPLPGDDELHLQSVTRYAAGL
jgi:hypothetical protein